MQLVIDIGNTNIVIGLYANDNLDFVWRLSTTVTDDINKYKERIVKLLFDARVPFDGVSLAVLSSVVPELLLPFESFLNGFFKSPVVVVGPRIYEHLELVIDRPHEIGTDIVANAYAARLLYAPNALVVDFGTALTVTAVGEDWQLHGVSIAPGIGTAMRSLKLNTAQLGEVDLVFPSTVMGKNTEHAIQSGILYGYTGLVRNLVSEYKRQWRPDIYVIATGGQSSLLPGLSDAIDIVKPSLTLDGLRAIGQRVSNSS